MSLRLLLLYCSFPILLLFTFRDPIFGIMSLALFYSIRPDIWGGPDFLRPAFILTVVTAISLFINQSSEYKIKLNAPIILFGLLGLWFLVNSHNALVSKELAWDFGIRFIKLLILLFMVTNIANSPKKVNMAFWVLIFGLLWLSKSVFVQSIIEGRPRVDPLGGTGGGGNAMATDLCMSLPFLFNDALEEKGWRRHIAIVLILLWIFDLVAIGSRGGFIALILGCFLFFMRYERKRQLVLIVIPVVIGLMIFGTSFFWDRIASIKNYKDEDRLMLWNTALKMHEYHPFFGVGSGNFPLMSPKYLGDETKQLVVHNSYLELLAENGYPGLILYLSGIGAVLILLRKTSTIAKKVGNKDVVRLGHVLEIALIIFLWRGITGSNQMAEVLYWYLGMAGGLHHYIINIRETAAKQGVNRS